MTNAKRLKSPTRNKIPQPTKPAMNKTMPEWVIEGTGKNIYQVLDGVRIAKRLESQAHLKLENAIPLEPGYEVFEGEGFSAIVIDKLEPRIQ